ncbi:MAG: VanZ family protein [Eubacteriales bacterium]|nr:VanZ family protein [Eubacteriales bacterium]
MGKKSLHKFLKWCVFIIYILALVYFMFFAESLGRAIYVREYRYNLYPFKEIMRFVNNEDILGMGAVLANVLGNVVAFAPFGFCLPMVTDHRMKFIRVTILSAGLSLMIELVQLVSMVGSFDVDDIILNTAGGIAGYILFCICKGILQCMKKNKKG